MFPTSTFVAPDPVVLLSVDAHTLAVAAGVAVLAALAATAVRLARRAPDAVPPTEVRVEPRAHARKAA